MRAFKDVRGRASPEMISPFDGDPKTHVVTDEHGGVSLVLVDARVVTPRRAKFADFLGGLTGIALWVGGLILLAHADHASPVMWVVALIAPALLYIPLQKLFRRSMRKQTVMVFTADKFSVGRRLGRPVTYDRHEIGCFRLKIHDKAKKEAELNELVETKARMRGRLIREKKYYQESFGLRVLYGGYPRDLMEILGEKDAERVLARLQAVNQFMDQVMAMGVSPASGPQSDWDDMPGKIPEQV